MRSIVICISVAGFAVTLTGCSAEAWNAINAGAQGAAVGAQQARQEQTSEAAQRKEANKQSGPFNLVSAAYNSATGKTVCTYQNVYGEFRGKELLGNTSCPSILY